MTPTSVSACRLSVDDFEAMLDGSPRALRQLAMDLDGDANVVVIELAGGAFLERRVTDDDRLRVTVRQGPRLVIEGGRSALQIVVRPMADLADLAEQVKEDAVRRHVHIEYLGEGDQGRSADSFPLVIGSDWPDPAR